MTGDVTDDLFFGGRMRLLQPRRGHRFGGDAALLVAAVRSRLGEGMTAADLGAGVGPVGLALAASGAAPVRLVEIDPELSVLSMENALRNGLEPQISTLCADVASVGRGEDDGASGTCDLVAANPPFDDGRRLRASPDAGKALAHQDFGDVSAIWAKAAARLLKSGGSFVMIHRPEALGDLLAALGPAFGDLRLRPVHRQAEAPASRLLIAARKGGRGSLKLLPAFVMHGADGGFTREADAAQRGDAVIAMD